MRGIQQNNEHMFVEKVEAAGDFEFCKVGHNLSVFQIFSTNLLLDVEKFCQSPNFSNKLLLR